MVLYNCPRCGYSTNQKSNIRAHYNRKKICNPILKDIGLDECKKTLDRIKDNICEHCNKKFSKKSNLRRHQDKCKDKYIEELKAEIIRLKQTQGSNNTINSHNKIIVNNYDNTEINKIKDKLDDIKILKDNVDTIVEYIKCVHFNRDLPENHNVYIENVNLQRLLKYDGQSFKEAGRGKTGIENFLQEDIGNQLENSNLSESDLCSAYDELWREYDSLGTTNKERDNDRRSEIRNKIISVLNGNKNIVKETHGIK